MGDFLMGSSAALFTPTLALGVGGLACMVGVLVAAGTQRGFLAYDSDLPVP
jgi:hypothetical protein